MGRTFQLVVALLVCSTGLVFPTNSVLSLLLAISGLVMLLKVVVKWLEEHGRRADPNYDKIYVAHERKYKFYIMTIMMFSMIFYLFPVSDWKFWLCMACLITDLVFKYSRIRNEQSVIGTKLASNTHESRISAIKDDPQ